MDLVALVTETNGKGFVERRKEGGETGRANERLHDMEGCHTQRSFYPTNTLKTSDRTNRVKEFIIQLTDRS